MTTIRSLAFGLALPMGLVATLASVAAAQVGGPDRTSREAMWPAPTAEDWKRPCLVRWQRSYEDALAVSRATNKPILVCVNMDGEIASEHYAGVRYRQPEIAALYEPYVTVIASVYRHNPRDHDEQGERILCPRFGSVTCAEHIAIEPGLFDKFMDGKRVAPRHIGVDPVGVDPGGDGLASAEIYDVYYAFDTDTIFEALRDGIAQRPTPPTTLVPFERSIVERVESPDNLDRMAVETAYIQGNHAERRALLEAAAAQGKAAPVELLRLAVFGFDLELARLARRALAASDSESAIDLIAEALRVPMDSGERDALIAALVRIGESSPRARTLAVVHRGLSSRSSTVDVEGMSQGLAGASPPAAASDRAALAERLERQAETLVESSGDGRQLIEFAEASLALARDPATDVKFARLLSEDAQRAALDAKRAGSADWRVDAALALASFDLDDIDAAGAHAEAALIGLTSGSEDWMASAVLRLFARSRQEAIVKALRAKAEPWPAQWLADVHAAYTVLARHPCGTDADVVAHHDFLGSLGASGQAARVLDEGLARFPEAWTLHDRLRWRILREQGVGGLESTYSAMLERENAPPSLEWFAGFASLVTAEAHRRGRDSVSALAAYDRAIAHYERAIERNPESRASSDHYIALGLAGRARIAFETGDDERALAEILASFARRPEAAAALDGLNLSAVDTARMLGARLREAGRDELVVTLQTALDGLDPELLRLPAFERDGPSQSPRGRRFPRREQERQNE